MKFALPSGVTAASRRALGKRAEGIDQVILDLEVVLNKLKQANLLFDAEVWKQIRKTKDQVKAQGKHDPEVRWLRARQNSPLDSVRQAFNRPCRFPAVKGGAGGQRKPKTRKPKTRKPKILVR